MVKSKKNLKQFHTKNFPLKKTNLKRKKINLNIKKASHVYPQKQYQKILTILQISLHHSINSCLKHARFPSNLKLAGVTPVL